MKSNFKTLVLSALSLMLISACTPASTPPVTDGAVGPQSFGQDSPEAGSSEKPRKFAGKFTGKCSVAIGNRTLTDYTTQITITQRPRLIVRTRIFPTPSSRRKISNSNSSAMINVKFSDETIDELRIDGHSLVNSKNTKGTINNVGFGFTREDGSTFVFKFLAVMRWEFWGTFQDDANRSTFVKCSVSRGDF